jgi:hypothetical protein
MRVKRFTVALSVVAMAALAAAPSVAAATGSGGAGLWPSTFSAGQTAADCGPFTLDSNSFCWVDESRDGVELGVKFQSSRALQISGVRIYRVDSSDVTGSLWSAAGGPAIATGTFSAAAPGHGWQDLTFSQPVSIVAGQTYIASYHSPNSQYAFQYDYFTNSAWAAGPITALQSVQGDPNGVFCYEGELCNHFPVNTYRDLNYWVTPLWSYGFTGFFQPVDNDKWNSAKAGSAIPVKFSLGGNLGLDVLKAGNPKATAISCPGAGAVVDAIEQTLTAGSSSLSYDPTSNQYSYVWKTDKAWGGKCMQFELGLNDGTSHTFSVQFK